MLTHLRRSVVIALLLVVFTFVYALAGTGISQALFGHQANGSITSAGSTLHRPETGPATSSSMAAPTDAGPYTANPKNDVAGGDNPLVANGVSGESAANQPRAEVQGARGRHEGTRRPLARPGRQPHGRPGHERLGSGYDPDISPQDAIVQIPMVSQATGIGASRLRALIAQETNGPELGFLGSSYIDVLQLNEALAKLR